MLNVLPSIDYDKIPKHTVSCACCGCAAQIHAYTGDRYGLGLSTVVCAKCGLVFTSPRPDDAWFAEFYRLHYRLAYESVEIIDKNYLDQDWIHGRHSRNVELLARFLPPQGSLLDVGCAEGTFLHLFRERFPQWLLEGIEPSRDFSAFAREHFGLGFVKTGSVENLITHYAHESFDLITVSHVLEHLLHPGAFFAIVRQLLKPDGLLFVDVPDVEGQSKGIGNLHIGHVYHFSMLSLNNFFSRFGFERIFSQKGDEVPKPWTLQMLARKRPARSEAWSPSPVDSQLVARNFARYCAAPVGDRLRQKAKQAGKILLTQAIKIHTMISPTR